METTIQNYLTSKNAKLYGDRIIGYRAQLEDGSYDDKGLQEIFETTYSEENEEYDDDLLLEFNNACFELRSGDHNWS